MFIFASGNFLIVVCRTFMCYGYKLVVSYVIAVFSPALQLVSHLTGFHRATVFIWVKSSLSNCFLTWIMLFVACLRNLCLASVLDFLLSVL